MKQYYIYILTNKANKVFYTGVTNNLVRRIYEHKTNAGSKFTSKYNVNKLVYFEIYEDIEQAILREKQIKAGSRRKKLDLIVKDNAGFKDLYYEIASP